MSFLHHLFDGLRVHAGLKLACHMGLTAWISFWYFSPQQWPFLDAVPAPTLGWEDAAVPFSPDWAVWYQSLFLVHTLAIWLPGKVSVVRRYTAMVAMVYAASAVVFWLYPTLSPRPASSDHFLYRWLVLEIDGPRNALPSLHAALATLAALQLALHVSVFHRVRRLWNVALALWWCGLIYSTLATRQHRILDLVAGVALVALIAALPQFRSFFRPTQEHCSAIPILRVPLRKSGDAGRQATRH